MERPVVVTIKKEKKIKGVTNYLRVFKHDHGLGQNLGPHSDGH